MKNSLRFFLGACIFYNSPDIKANVYEQDNRCEPFDVQCRTLNYPLVKYSLSELKMIGVIRQGEKIWALIQTPDQQVYSAAVKDRAGIEGGYIVKITSEKITVQEKEKTFIDLTLYAHENFQKI